MWTVALSSRASKEEDRYGMVQNMKEEGERTEIEIRKIRRTITKVPMTRLGRHVNILDPSSRSYRRSGIGSEVEYGLSVSSLSGHF